MTWEGPMTDTVMDIKKLSPEVEALQNSLIANVIGQERAIKRIVKAYVPMTVNMHRPGRPLGVFLFMGPTGVGKTETVRVFAHKLLGSRDAITRVDCAEYGESHEMLKLLGAPPSYVGSDIEPLLSQKNIDKYQTTKSKVNILLFDEIEKSHMRLHDGILTILGDGRLTLNNNKSVDFSNSFIFLTTNLGSKEMANAAEGAGIGFTRSVAEKKESDDRLYRSAKEAAKKKFRPEFMNRLDSTIVFRPLERDSLMIIMAKELEELQWRIWSAPYRDFKLEPGAKMPPSLSIRFKLTDTAKEFLLKEGTSELYGARELNRAIDRFVGFPMASIIASKQAEHGDRIKVDWANSEDKNLTFTNKGKITE